MAGSKKTPRRPPQERSSSSHSPVGIAFAGIVHLVAVVGMGVRVCARSGDDAVRIGAHFDDMARAGKNADDLLRAGRAMDSALDYRFPRINEPFPSAARSIDDLHPTTNPKTFDELDAYAQFDRDIVRVGRSAFGDGDTLVRLGLDLTQSGAEASTRTNRMDGAPFEALEHEVLHFQRLATPPSIKPPPRVRNPELLAIVPDDERAFLNVFGQHPSMSAMSEMRRAKRLFDELDAAQSVSSPDFGYDDLSRLISAKPNASNTIVIIGHSDTAADTGRVLRLPNGDSVDIAEISRLGLRHDRQVLVLTCHGDDFRIPGQLSLMDAYHMLVQGLRASRKSALTTAEFIESVRVERQARNIKKVVIVGVVAGAGGSGAMLVTSRYRGD